MGAEKGNDVEIRVNGAIFDIERGESDTIGDLLSRADSLLETAGAVIIALSFDGASVDPDDLPALSSKPAASISRLDIAAESSSDHRAKAIDLLLGVLAAASPLPDAEGRRALRDSLSSLAGSLGGLFPADELSFIHSLEEASSLGAEEKPEELARLAERIAGLDRLFHERLAELRDPIAEFRRAASVYRGAAEELRELPVWLQTGKEQQAMQAVLVFVELFNKIIRLMPELGRRGVEASAIRVGDLDLPAFYAAFNEILKELAKAIEDRDSVLIGDLSEYEVAPRMEGLFAAIGGTLP